MYRFHLFALTVVVSLFAACSRDPKETVLGEAYVGPATLKLRAELNPKSPEIATVKHGDKVQIVQRRRRFLKVRAPGGAAGWTEMRQLMASSQMDNLDATAERAAQLPSQGAASVYEPLNVHTDPNRYSPSFYQVKEGEEVQVVEHRLTPRVPYDDPDILPKPAPKPKKVKKKDEEKEAERIKKPPKPPGPPVPPNWLELSKSPVYPEEKPKEVIPPKPVPMDDWSLIRLKNGRAGWVLSRMLKMNIPDEVAQYSEGHRITSYFPMKDVQDEGVTRHHWLWTTINGGQVPYEFDSFRYFIWNTRRHRYETAYVERNLKGYYPVLVHPVEATVGKKTETFPGFTLILEGEDGQKYKCTYAYEYYLVKLVSKTPIAPAPEGTDEMLRLAAMKPESAKAEKSFYSRMKENVTSLKQKWFGK